MRTSLKHNKILIFLTLIIALSSIAQATVFVEDINLVPDMFTATGGSGCAKFNLLGNTTADLVSIERFAGGQISIGCSLYNASSLDQLSIGGWTDDACSLPSPFTLYPDNDYLVCEEGGGTFLVHTYGSTPYPIINNATQFTAGVFLGDVDDYLTIWGIQSITIDGTAFSIPVPEPAPQTSSVALFSLLIVIVAFIGGITLLSQLKSQEKFSAEKMLFVAVAIVVLLSSIGVILGVLLT